MNFIVRKVTHCGVNCEAFDTSSPFASYNVLLSPFSELRRIWGCLDVWQWLFLKCFLLEMYQNNIFLKKLFLISVHQNNLETLKKILT